MSISRAIIDVPTQGRSWVSRNKAGGASRVLHVLASLDPAHGGVIDGALRLGEVWREWGVESEFATADSPRAPYLVHVAFPVHALGRVGLGIGRRPASFTQRVGVSRLPGWLRAHAPAYDGIVVHALWNFSTLAARIALPGAGTPYVVFPHGALDPWFAHTYPAKHRVKKLTWRLVEEPLLRQARAVLFTTAEEERLADKMFRPYRLKACVVGFGSSAPPSDPAACVAAFHDVIPALRHRRFLLFLSRIHPKKGCDLLLNAFAKMSTDPALSLVVAGPDQTGWQAELERRSVALGVADRVLWPGMISGDAKWGAFLACEAFVLPSHSENFGIVVAEALACGRPVLITDKVNLWREVADDRAGLVETDDVEGVARLLSRFAALDGGERAVMAKNARACFDRHFRFEVAARRTLEALGMTAEVGTP